MDQGYIKLFREITDWEWYKHPDMMRLWIHLLISANHKDNKWQGKIIKTGQLVTGRKSLSEGTGLSESTIRTCLKKLKSTSEITSKSTNKFTIITIVNWSKYQGKSTSKSTNNLTNNQPAKHEKLTTNKNDINKNVKNNIAKTSFRTENMTKIQQIVDKYLALTSKDESEYKKHLRSAKELLTLFDDNAEDACKFLERVSSLAPGDWSIYFAVRKWPELINK